jgi:hypothetical protein
MLCTHFLLKGKNSIVKQRLKTKETKEAVSELEINKAHWGKRRNSNICAFNSYWLQKSPLEIAALKKN